MKNVSVGAIVPPDLRAQANAAAANLGITTSEYMRQALIHLARTGSNPFGDHSRVKRGRPPIQVDMSA